MFGAIAGVLLLLLLVAPCLNCLEAVKKPPPVAFKVMCLLSLTIRQPPRSPLLPFTTHFLSLLFFCAQARPAEQAGAALQAVRQAYGMQAQPDRKSTRLNSSHLVISYAVFCLKKKKILDNRE